MGLNKVDRGLSYAAIFGLNLDGNRNPDLEWLVSLLKGIHAKYPGKMLWLTTVRHRLTGRKVYGRKKMETFH